MVTARAALCHAQPVTWMFHRASPHRLDRPYRRPIPGLPRRLGPAPTGPDQPKPRPRGGIAGGRWWARMWGQARAAARVGSPLGLCRGLHASSRPPTSFSKILESRRHQIHTHRHRPSPGFSQLRDRPGEDFSSVPPLDQPTTGQGDTYRAGRFDGSCSS